MVYNSIPEPVNPWLRVPPKQKKGEYVLWWEDRAPSRRGSNVWHVITARAFETEADAREYFQLGDAFRVTLTRNGNRIDYIRKDEK